MVVEKTKYSGTVVVMSQSLLSSPYFSVPPSHLKAHQIKRYSRDPPTHTPPHPPTTEVGCSFLACWGLTDSVLV